MKILAIDPGTKNIGLAYVIDGVVQFVHTLKDVGHKREDVYGAGHDIMSLLADEPQDFPNDVLILIEVPSTRWFGRQNSTAMHKIFWQIIFLIDTLYPYCNIDYQDAYNWNIGQKRKQRTDKEKKEIFYDLFPNFKQSTNKDNRDAALMAVYYENKNK